MPVCPGPFTSSRRAPRMSSWDPLTAPTTLALTGIRLFSSTPMSDREARSRMLICAPVSATERLVVLQGRRPGREAAGSGSPRAV